MYLDTLDSVRFDPTFCNVSESCNFAKAAVMSNLALGKSIVLSQTQLIDSKFILDSLGDPDFRQLFEEGFIRLSLYDRKPGCDVLKHLSMYYSADSDFKYSMCRGDGYSQKNYSETLCALLQKDYTAETNLESLYQIKQILPFIASLERNPGIVNAVTSGVSLGQLLGEHARKTNDQILKTLVILDKSKKDKRSYYYHWLDSLENKERARLKSIVDIYYNYVLGRSVQNNTNIELTAPEKSVSDAEWKVIRSVCDANGGSFKKIGYSIVASENLPSSYKITWNELYLLLKQGYVGDRKNTLWHKALYFAGTNPAVAKVLIASGGDAIAVVCGMIPIAKKIIPLIEILKSGLMQGIDCLNDNYLEKYRSQIKIEEIKTLKGRIK